MPIKRSIPMTIEPTPEELAQCFCNASSDSQASFFNAVAKLVERWDAPFPIQAHAIITDPGLTLGGRRILEILGEYGRVEDEE